MSTAPQDSTAVPKPSEAGPAHLDLVPVDPHRLFAHWNLPPQDLERLRDMAGDQATNHHLTLRLFRLPHGGASLRNAVSADDFPVGATHSDGYFSLSEPGGNVVAVLGIKNAENHFTPAVTSVRITLPEAPRSAAMAEPRATIETPAAAEELFPAAITGEKEKSAPKVGERPPVVLDEATVVAAAGRIERLPEQLRTVPSQVAPTVVPVTQEEPASSRDASPPNTPVLDERNVVTSALRHMLADTVVPDLLGEVPAESEAAINDATQHVPPSADAVSSYRLASQMDAGLAGAPVHLHATLSVTGRLAPGQKLRVGDKQITATPGGSIAFRHELDSTDAIWPLLLHAVLNQPARSMPSLELLSELPDSEALLSLHASIDIEGQIHDRAYRSRLPREVKVDEAGRFRIVRPLPAGALLLPHLVLVASGEEVS